MPLRSKLETSNRTIPFVIAATGHRDLRSANIDQLKDRVRKILVELAESMPSTPLLVLTGLAEGADQLVAQVALEIGIDFAAIIPMPMTLYSEQMSEKGRAELYSLYEKAALKVHLPMVDPAEDSMCSSESLGAERYKRLASFLGTHSQALIALWDGLDSGLSGGTAEVVARMLKRLEDTANSEEGTLTKSVYHIVTPRESNSEIPDAFEVRQLWPRDKSTRDHGDDYMAMRKDLDRFNHAVAEDTVDSGGKFAEGLLDEEHQFLLSLFLSRVAAVHRSADRISLRFGKKRNAFLILILVFALTGIFGLELHSEIFSNLDFLWLIFPLSVSAAAGLYIVAKRLRIENQFLDSRSFAEALRIQFYWGLSGIDEPASKHYLRHHRGSIDWIRTALLNISLFRAQDPSSPGDKEGMKATLTLWVEAQASWFSAKAEHQRRTLARLERIANRSLCSVVALSFLIALSLLLPAPWHSAWQSLVHEHLNGILHLLIAVPSIALGIFKIWVDQAGYDEQARNYSHMANLFAHRACELKEYLEADKLSDARDVIRDLGIQALQENGSWLVMHREHPLKVVGL